MSIFIDRRLNSKGKSTVNRERFMRRYRIHIRRAVNDAVNKRSITDTETGESIAIDQKDLSEPFFQHGEGGYQKHVHPGNKEFVTGDRFKRPRNNSSTKANGKIYEGKITVDDFVFQINRDEFLTYLFDDLELPNMVSKTIKDTPKAQYKRLGVSSHGAPERINIIKSLKNSYARRIAILGKEKREINELKKLLAEMESNDVDKESDQFNLAKSKLIFLEQRIKRLPFIDDFDLKYDNLKKTPVPSGKAVMFCLMDVSGSMTRDIKDIAKRFFLLLYLFLQYNYKSVEIVFIRHHAEAKICCEEDFFYARETGGTVVSSALNLTYEVMKKKYNSSEWNVYVAQASDGDNWEADSPRCVNIIRNYLMPHLQYFSYVEITDRQHQNLWHEYKVLTEEYKNSFAMSQIRAASDIYPVFRQLFEKREIKL